ncbi:unnamed protein product [Hymenolepis diminuta]|uniref:FZ domain-containing protein n=1 Tax=Hymenolepis diminuta TaxID=6216 RepID=A0A0R3SZE7_HYMDI|nr:unnamed protein product [Hymenolepis diminuta]
MRKWHSDVKDCMGRIMEATCYYHFPICPPPSEESASKSTEASPRRRLCREDCHVITDGECSNIYRLLLPDTQSQGNLDLRSGIHRQPILNARILKQ